MILQHTHQASITANGFELLDKSPTRSSDSSETSIDRIFNRKLKFH